MTTSAEARSELEWYEANPLDDDDAPSNKEDASPSPDPDAPFGRNPKTGKPYTMSAERRADMGRRLAEARAAALSGGSGRRKARGGPKSSGPPRANSRPAAGPNYRPAVAGLLQLIAFPLAIAGKFDPVYALDAAAVALHTDAIAEAAHVVALDNGRMASVLERVGEVGPWGALLLAGMPLLLQLAANHGLVAPNATMGVLGQEDLIEALNPEGTGGRASR